MWHRVLRVIVLTFLATSVAFAQPGETARISISSTGQEGNAESGYSMSAAVDEHGRFVAFLSEASNLVLGDTNNCRDVFLKDRWTGELSRVSVSSSGEQGNKECGQHSIAMSRDGRYIAFASDSTNLVPNDTNNGRDVFVHDTLTAETTRVSVTSFGAQSNSWSGENSLSISDDGRYVCFDSWSSDLVPLDFNNFDDIFVHDRELATTTLVSLSSTGVQGNSDSVWSQISGNGEVVAFTSRATNLVAGGNSIFNGAVYVRVLAFQSTEIVSISNRGEFGNSYYFGTSIDRTGSVVSFVSASSNLVENDTNNATDLFVRDRANGLTTRESVGTYGFQGNKVTQGFAKISSDGRYLVFASLASNLVPFDLNNINDVFVRDRYRHRTIRVSVSSVQGESNGNTFRPAVSGDGTLVVYGSRATNLVPADLNGVGDVFTHVVRWGKMLPKQTGP